MNASARPSTTSRRQDWNQANSWMSTKPTKPKKPIATKSTSTTSCSSPATSSKATKTWRPASAPASHGSPSTNTKTSRPCSIGCSPDGSVTTATSAWSATRHRPSTRSPEPAATTCSTSPPNSDPSPPTSDSTTTTVPPRRSSTTPTACSKPHRNAPTISNSTPSETKAAESRKPSTTAISKKPGAWLHASADSWTKEHLRATAPSSPESTRSRKSSAGHWANNICATASNETADGRTPRSRMTLRPAWPCWKHLAQAATLKA